MSIGSRNVGKAKTVVKVVKQASHNFKCLKLYSQASESTESVNHFFNWFILTKLLKKQFTKMIQNKSE